MAAAAVLGLPSSGAAQTSGACGVVPGLAGGVGWVSYPVSGGISGFAAGLDLAFESDPYAVRLAYRRTFLEGDAADPDVLRGEAALALADLADGIRFCAVGHMGATRFSFDGDAGFVLAGGLGIRLTRPGGAFHPFIGFRGLGARAVGRVLGLDVDAAGFSFGAELGATYELGRWALRVVGSADGFDDGLGVTPYPGRSVELAIDYRF